MSSKIVDDTIALNPDDSHQIQILVSNSQLFLKRPLEGVLAVPQPGQDTGPMTLSGVCGGWSALLSLSRATAWVREQ